MTPKLDRRKSERTDHLEKYPLTAATLPTKPVPTVAGVNWYTDFDEPVKDGNIYVIKGPIRGSIRGGHCVCFEPAGIGYHDSGSSWWDFYDQGDEGACVGFGTSRMLSLLHRKKMVARWLWREARLRDEWTDNDDMTDEDQGTSVRAGLDVAHAMGGLPWQPSMDVATQNDWAWEKAASVPGNRSYGISAYRWATDVNDFLHALGMGGKDYAVLLNSWGRAYPHRVKVEAEVLDRLLREDGEFGVPLP